MTNEKLKHEVFEELACQLERQNLWRRAAHVYLAASMPRRVTGTANGWRRSVPSA